MSIRSYDINLGVVYRPPKTLPVIFREAATFIKGQIESMSAASTTSTTILMGDFNIPKTTKLWQVTENGVIPCVSDKRDDDWRSSELILEMAADCFLSQIVRSPTRGDSFLDLIFVNDTDVVQDVVTEVTKISDHESILLQTNIGSLDTPIQKSKEGECATDIARLDFRRADWSLLRRKFRESDIVENVKRTESVTDGFNVLIDSITKVCISAQIPRRKLLDKYKIIPVERRKLFRKKCKLAKQLRNRVCSALRTDALKMKSKTMQRRESDQQHD